MFAAWIAAIVTSAIVQNAKSQLKRNSPLTVIVIVITTEKTATATVIATIVNLTATMIVTATVFMMTATVIVYEMIDIPIVQIEQDVLLARMSSETSKRIKCGYLS